jgi:hypothetical protein
VPADRGADLAAELGPLFAQLDQTERLCAQIRERAQRDATVRRERHAERARSIVREASEQSDAERAKARVLMQRRAETESATALAAAEREAADLSDRAAQRIPEYVAQVVAAVRDLTGGQRPAGAT